MSNEGVWVPKKQLLLSAARNLLAHQKVGRHCDPHELEWAEWIVKHNGAPPGPPPTTQEEKQQ